MQHSACSPPGFNAVFACAVPGIVAARTISDPRDRLVTILMAPLR
jgi:Fe2+ transport system protein B